MNKQCLLFLLCCACLLLLCACQAVTAVTDMVSEDEDVIAIIDVEAPVHTPAPKKLLTPPPTPSPSPMPSPTPVPTEAPTPSPSPKATKKPEKEKTPKPEKTEKPKKTENPAAFTVDENAGLMPVIANNPDTAISDILAMTNRQRANSGLPELKRSSALSKAAATRAKEISVSFSHTRPNGSSALSISSSAYAENIAYGMNISHAAIMDGWMNSPGHRANILNGSYATIGIGFYSTNGNNYYVQLFGY